MVSEIFRTLYLSPGFQISNSLAKLYINIYHIKKNSGQSLQWLGRNSLDKILAVLDTHVGQPSDIMILNFETLLHNFTSISTISPNFRTIRPVVTEKSS